jgi:hypothetical protein
MKLKQSLFLVLTVAVLSFATGCQMFGKSKVKKDDPAIASGVEADFRHRWMEHRIVELTATGLDATAARQQAETEFRDKYAYLKDPKKK